MNSDDLPNPYELARLAAALRGREAVKKPAQASREALRLWLAAGDEIAREKERREAEETGRWQKQKEANTKPDDRRLRISLGKNGKSEAMEWLNADSETHKRDKFDRFATFIKAWCKFETADGKFFLDEKGELRVGYDNTDSTISTDLERLKLFRRTREEKRLSSDAERKRNERSKGR